LKLGDKTIREEMDKLMQHMGYGSQPYFFYKHKDLERVHFHIVSSRIDRQTGKKIKDNHERQKVQNFIKELELRYQLDNKNVVERSVFKFSARSRNIKQSLENLFLHLNQMESINSKVMYDEALKLFNVEVRKSGRGHIVVVTDGKGKVIRYPIRLSKFKDQAKFYQKENQPIETPKRIKHKDTFRQYSMFVDFLKELNNQIMSQELKNNRVKQLKNRKKKRKLRP